MEISITLSLFLFISGFSAGFVDSIAGGGGLISLPSLLFIGLPPQLALGTNKFQSSFGSLTATINYIKNKKANIESAKNGIFATIIGASAGTIFVQLIDSNLLQWIIPFLLILVLIYIILSPKVSSTDTEKRMDQGLFFIIFGISLGFYDGFFGPGTGNFWVVLFISLLGFNIVTDVPPKYHVYKACNIE